MNTVDFILYTMTKIKLLVASTLLFAVSSISQDNIRAFDGTRIINGHSAEQIGKKVLEFRVEHRFGDLAGSQGGVQSMFGLDNSSDIRLAFEYGITDKMMVGFGRSKGAGTPYRSLLDGFFKYSLLQQKEEGSPLSLTLLGTSAYSYMKASEDIALVSHFPKAAHRFAYSAQAIASKKIGSSFSLALMPTMVHRNYVAADDVNTLFAMGGAFRWSITENLGFITEYYHALASSDLRSNKKNSLSVAFEWLTFGHNFTIYLSNARGFGETQFIADTQEDWLKGQFRLGFCIGRKFEWE
jgi:hypothetical protein